MCVIAERRHGSPASISLKRDRRNTRVCDANPENARTRQQHARSRALRSLFSSRVDRHSRCDPPRAPPLVAFRPPRRRATRGSAVAPLAIAPDPRVAVRSGSHFRRGVLPVPPSHDRTLTSAPRSRRPPTRNQPHTMPKKRRANGRNKPAGARGHVRTPTARQIARRDRTREPRSRVRVFAPNARAALPDDAPNDPPRPGVRPAPRRAPAVNDRAPPAVAVSHPAAVPDHRDALGRPGRRTQR